MSRVTFINLKQLADTNLKIRLWKHVTITNEIHYLTRNHIISMKPSRCNYKLSQTRSFINFLVPEMNKKIYKDRKLIGYSPVQMFDVIQDTENYKHFLPFCRQSTVKLKEKNHAKTYLEIGFPPIIESYVSHITFNRPHMIKAECHDGKLFKSLTTQWNCDPGLKDNQNTCIITFFVSYEFKSQLHSSIANVFFNELVKQMEQAFFDEAYKRYGKPCIIAKKLSII